MRWFDWGGWGIAALVVLVWVLSATCRNDSPMVAYHHGHAEAFSDLLLGLQVSAATREAELQDIDAAKASAVVEYLDDPEGLCDALDRLTR